MHWLRKILEEHWHPLARPVRRIILALAAAATVLLVVVLTSSQQDQTVSGTGWITKPSAVPSQASVPTSGNLTAQIWVHVVGAVQHPGLYQLKFGARVVDAIFAAGGFLSKADQSSVNLARLVNDGEQVIIQIQGVASGMGVPASSTATVNLNLADAAALDALPGIGPTLAQRIIDYRQANGGFRSISDLGKVAGIGQSLLGKLRDKVSL